MADRQHTTKEERKFNFGVNDGVHSMNVGYEANDQRHATNCDKSTGVVDGTLKVTELVIKERE